MNFNITGIVAKTFIGVILLYVLFQSQNNGLFAQHASVSDIFAGYKVNASLYQGARVCYKLTVVRKEDNYSREVAYDYWSDGRDVLLRGGDLNVIGGVEKILSGQFPDSITSQDFRTIYRGMPVISYDSKEELGYCWLVG